MASTEKIGAKMALDSPQNAHIHHYLQFDGFGSFGRLAAHLHAAFRPIRNSFRLRLILFRLHEIACNMSVSLSLIV